jgi:hypothetical protein
MEEGRKEGREEEEEKERGTAATAAASRVLVGRMERQGDTKVIYFVIFEI